MVEEPQLPLPTLEKKSREKFFLVWLHKGRLADQGGWSPVVYFDKGGTLYVVGWLRRHSFATQILGAWTAAVFAVGDLPKSFVGEQLLLQQETDNPDQGVGQLW